MDVSGAYVGLRTIHIGAGFLGLAVFWIPLLVRKGSRLHVLCGRVFVACAAVLLASALLICTWRMIEPVRSFSPNIRPPAEETEGFVRTARLIYLFLGALAVYTVVPLYLGLRVVRTRQHPDRLAGGAARPLLALEVMVSLALIAYAAALWVADPGMAFSAVPLGAGVGGLGAAWWDWRFIAKPRTTSMDWLYKHMEFMLRTGIAFHSAFAVFVLTPWFGPLGSSPWALVPWVVPSVIGVPAAWIWIRHYRLKFASLRPLPESGPLAYASACSL